MQLTKEIKEFLAQGGKVLVVENGEPLMVITPFKEHMGHAQGYVPVAPPTDFMREAEEINREIKAFTGDDFFTSFETERQAAEIPPGSGFYREPL